jgi:c-di-GMP-binding flagellar brake protein YcgR
MMQDERRRFTRVETHIVIKLINKFTQTEHLGYIENISEGGIGVVSLDLLPSGSQFATIFFLPEISRKLTPHGYVVYSRKGTELANYYGICFRSLPETDQSIIAGYVRNTMLQQTSGS